MLNYRILKGASSLRKKSSDVSSLEEGLDILDKLYQTLERESGVGLSANQIGINKRACVIKVPNKDRNGTLYTLFYKFLNPRIIKMENPIIFKNEGCLSFPDIGLTTLRYNNIVVEDLLSPGGRSFEGLAAVCAQHEIDHTNGIIMHNRLYSLVKDEAQCPCESGKLFKQCCKKKIKNYGDFNDKLREKVSERQA